MATKVYLSGKNIIVDQDGMALLTIRTDRAKNTTLIPFASTDGKTPVPLYIQFDDVVLLERRTELITDIQDQAGNPLPSIYDLSKYLDGFFQRSGASVINTAAIPAATTNLQRVLVNQGNVSETLGGPIDSTKQYFIDGIIDCTGVSIEIPISGIAIKGYDFNLSKLICSDNSYTMFTSPGGGSGNVLISEIAIEVTGTGSKVYDLVANTGFEAIEVDKVNYNDCTSRGEMNNYRQGLERGTGYFGGMPELTLTGTWLGGFFIDVSIVRSLTAGTYSLFKAGTAFLMSSRFRSNQNIDLPTGVSLVDFSPSNFVNPSTLQFNEVILTRNGVFDSTDALYTPNVTSSDLISSWRGCQGLSNTFVGGKTQVTIEATTIISSPGVYVDVLGAFSTNDLEHFDSPAEGRLRHLGNDPIEFDVFADFTIESNQNNELGVRITKFIASTATFQDFNPQLRQVNSLVGGRDVAFFTISSTITLNKNDYIKFQVANIGSSQNVTIEESSFYRVSER